MPRLVWLSWPALLWLVADSNLASADCTQLVVDGQSATAATRFDEGRALFWKAYRDCSDPVALVHIGKSYQDQGNFDKALEYVERFLTEAGESHPLYKPLSEAAVALRAKVKPKARPPRTEPAPAHPPAVAPAPEIDRDEPTPRWYADPVGAVLAVGGLAAIGYGNFALLQSSSDADSAREATSFTEHRELEDRARRRRAISLVSLGVGTALVAAAIWRYAGKRREQHRVAVAPIAGSQFAGLAVGGAL